ncbi:septation protein A [Candidatus Symbiobacter mobilis]|uniref:Inner membrane-spanning protein YciB n=1 Tax=Candidatus Symbiobacter mobilis CR TaxID=946483 RepID=U5N8I7_9BURK|nr:septation protein A [Candidatus Symbiobacter mobilis]AGX86583.1 intracellular septation protein A [Candidatus Symbiobacter mobilis CR]
MRTLLDFLPIVLFFGAYKLYDIYMATAVLMAATVVQMGVVWAMDRKLQAIHQLTLGLILLFGSLTLLLHDERFIKWKPTVLYAAMGIALGAAAWVWRKNVLKMILGSQLDLPDFVWMRLQHAWVGYCVFMSAINAYVVLLYSTETWMYFKLWGYVFPLVFLLGQGVYIARHWTEPAGDTP